MWLEGSADTGGSLKHTIFSYNTVTEMITKIADVSHVENPFNITRLRNGTVCFADRIDHSWMIRIIDLDSMKETSIPLDQYPQQPCSDGEIVVWKEGVRDLWYMDLSSWEKKKVTAVQNPTLFDIHGGCIFTSVSMDDNHIYQCNVTDKTVTCITQSANEKYDKIDFRFFNFYKDKMVCIYDRTLYGEDKNPIGVKYDLVIVDGIY